MLPPSRNGFHGKRNGVDDDGPDQALLASFSTGGKTSHPKTASKIERWKMESALMDVEGPVPPSTEDGLLELIHRCFEVRKGLTLDETNKREYQPGFMVVRLVRGFFQDDYEKAYEFLPRIEDYISETAFEVQWDDVTYPAWTLYRLATSVPMTWDKEGLEKLRNNRSHIRQLAGISWRLQELTGNGTFGLPQELLANYLGITRQDVSKAIIRLLKIGWLKAERPKGHTLRYSCTPYERTL